MSCSGCWWNEGGRCYVEPVERSADGRSTRLAEERCGEFKSANAVWDSAVTSGRLLGAVAEALTVRRVEAAVGAIDERR